MVGVGVGVYILVGVRVGVSPLVGVGVWVGVGDSVVTLNEALLPSVETSGA